jgi:hypothetical protein
VVAGSRVRWGADTHTGNRRLEETTVNLDVQRSMNQLLNKEVQDLMQRMEVLEDARARESAALQSRIASLSAHLDTTKTASTAMLEGPLVNARLPRDTVAAAAAAGSLRADQVPIPVATV